MNKCVIYLVAEWWPPKKQKRAKTPSNRYLFSLVKMYTLLTKKQYQKHLLLLLLGNIWGTVVPTFVKRVSPSGDLTCYFLRPIY